MSTDFSVAKMMGLDESRIEMRGGTVGQYPN